MLSRFAKRLIQVPDPVSRRARLRPGAGRPDAPGRQVGSAARPGKAGRRSGLARFVAPTLAWLGLAAGAAADCGGGRDLLAELETSDPAAWRQVMAEAQAEPDAVGVYWRIEAPGAAPSYLLGSYHVPHPLIDQTPAAPMKALAGARAMLMEMAPQEAARLGAILQSDPGLLANLDHPSLKTVMEEQLGAGAFDPVEAALTALGLPAGQAAALRPWFVAISLATPSCAMADLAGGAGAMDMRFARRAGELGLPVIGMETWETLLPTLQRDEWSPESLAALELAARDVGRGRDLHTTAARLYVAETVWPIWTFGQWEARRAGLDAGADESRQLLIKDRNLRFVEAATPELRRGGVFVIVGAMHLGGEGGMLELLRARGFEVAREPLR